MKQLEQYIETYLDTVTDSILISPFEFLHGFHVRSSLHQKKDLLSAEQKRILLKYDKLLFYRSSEIYNHMKVIYHFENSSMSIEEWWWHLDKVVNKTVTIDFESQIIVYNRQTYEL
ncbi:hypothetical protein BLGI_4266 [Brevibacillus laterosporus GI-9]|uniref:hypothetical protein n=1 Tax=Brevibacillus TaxID=55080 RepID=UPI0002405185|nr:MULTISPECIES: hypothetical protein [Brevibacillus]MCR8963691.1 hypothetical protein [Brevibacillus laterosporus]MCZ0835847.1 hypothetical protein [Brevibacillus halotolerans]CCF16298.1 hypothetical protein BLGI_4266 [Brevibacillus laterosporus GI-9]